MGDPRKDDPKFHLMVSLGNACLCMSALGIVELPRWILWAMFIAAMVAATLAGIGTWLSLQVDTRSKSDGWPLRDEEVAAMWPLADLEDAGREGGA